MKIGKIGIAVAPFLTVAGLAATIIGGIGLTARSASATGHYRGAGAEKAAPVIVELFTSEGCSSCPSADRVLAGLQSSQPVGGAHIIALGEHVDYWDRLGWRDPFSSADFSARQYGYADAFHTSQVYTPQMIVDGRTEFVGSDEDRARAAIAESAARPKADVSLQATADGAFAHLKISVSHLPARTGEADVFAAIAEDNLSTNVPSGENAGRRLAHSAVVRRLVRVGSIKNGAFTQETNIPVASGWKRSSLRAVVFVQEKSSRRILGAAEAGLAS